jgi:hypothetical protein
MDHSNRVASEDQTQERGYSARSIPGNQCNRRVRRDTARINKGADTLGNVSHLAPGNPLVLEFDAGSHRVLG